MAGFIFEEAMMEDIIFISNAARGDHPGCRQGQSLDRQIEGSMKSRVVVLFFLSFFLFFSISHSLFLLFFIFVICVGDVKDIVIYIMYQ